MDQKELLKFACECKCSYSQCSSLLPHSKFAAVSIGSNSPLVLFEDVKYGVKDKGAELGCSGSLLMV